MSAPRVAGQAERQAPDERHYRVVLEDPAATGGPDFIARVEHDLLAPVRTIRNLPDWIADDLEEADIALPETVSEFLGTIKGQARRLEQLIRDLNRFERLALHEITLTEICVETRLDELTALLLPEGPWRVETLGHADPLITDATLFDEIMSELISNAIKHHSDFDGFIRISIGEAAGSISVEISDNGPGVPSGQLNRIFWPLVKLRSRDEVAGSGLGMSIALRATQKLGGRVEVCAGADTGFALRVVLPKHATGMVAGA